MTVTIRKQSVDRLARRLATLRGVTITNAVEGALEAAFLAETRRKSPSEIAREILAERGVVLAPGARKPVTQSAYHDLDHDLIGEDD
ncbi:MAG: type II toxin-antitoxin system VapB family antitoxin [Brevundimonas sp.]|uniref:type II toxin-antitoxin system VapB family antitoxin n=1 Tax=Brevundimonas sp. TaxID=1871086 RepID=UPI0027210D67|nr:type II toxin-antitoxin system VapB family antitoxin [Brevundimonas sp.]MDO9202090.1 type II toxin-antitoxin system VapB family antitoxin [Hydrogenophaga sp.]MDZ4320551.1 type II toxin-antitoxin system VapB family antitoxin [Phenylobacterium sp.]MDO9588774.1 type II toxin-antitoxin system VapB family antitoxin [Brevundimonas sp.]MDP3657916.1 type II toxin-antitoxin system VapB family antitoxin [Brevundimonas sp.]MDZ4109758.1 type II toxin-antitoxin system VapB family antitoxin [Brevundimona